MTQVPKGTRAVTIAGVVAVVLYAAWAAIQILVLNPLAAVPGRSLDEIRNEMSARGEPLDATFTLMLLAAGCVIAGVVAVLIIRARLAPAPAAIMMLAGLAMGAPAYFIASFGPGMSLADAFLISGGDHSPWGLPLYAASLFAVIAAVALAVGSLARERRVPASA